MEMTWDLASTFILGFQDGVERAAQNQKDYRSIQKSIMNDTSLIPKCLEELTAKPDLDPEIVAYSVSFHAARKLMG